MADVSKPQASVVICTDGRAEALAQTLEALRHLSGVVFDVCVVCGPTVDGTADVLDAWRHSIKVEINPDRNLSKSRNIGLAAVTADIVAFIDDDGIPEPLWLEEIVRSFDDPNVGGAGGIVIDHTGSNIQYMYSSADRLGNADWARSTPCDQFNFPLSYNFPYVQGTNSAFRREALIDAGGFDEEFEFYLDETDVCCRLIDLGWSIRQLPNATVHHKSLPSAIRSKERVTRVLYSVLKNKLYFSLINNQDHFGLDRAIADMQRFINLQESGIRHHISAGNLRHSDLERFWRDVDAAWNVGLSRGLSRTRRLIGSPARVARQQDTLTLFPLKQAPARRGVFVFISQEHPDSRPGGIGRYVDQLARSVSELGHTAHLITVGSGHDRVDFERGVWVHRVVGERPSSGPDDLAFKPSHIWAWSLAVLAEIRIIQSRDDVTAVYAPIWDCEGAAVLQSREFALVVGLQTTLHFWLHSHPEFALDEVFQGTFGRPMIALEKRLMQEADGVHAISNAIARDISLAYSVNLSSRAFDVVPLALEDWSDREGGHVVAAEDFDSATKPTVRILFVGRLELRKGIDQLLDIIPSILNRFPEAVFDIVGRDDLIEASGRTFRENFETTTGKSHLDSVRFHGEVTELQLRTRYSACDIVVAPSRFESFGLVVLEAMMHSKPTVAARAGGLVEVGEDGVTTLYFDPEDVTSFEANLTRLVSDASLRREMSTASRRRYVEMYSPEKMAIGVVALMQASAVHFKDRKSSGGVAEAA